MPSESEQTRLVGLVTLERQLSSSIRRSSECLREFRTRLITDVVTGKLDVRALAADLPEVTEPEPTDELPDGGDMEEALEDIENEEVAA